MIGWGFPSNSDGQEQGPNHPGIETFLDDPLSSLARETCQNSLDAADSESGSPVEIHYTLDLVDREEVPGIDDLANFIDKCRTYWEGNAKGRQLFDRAAQVALASKLPILQVSDYNTEGLVGSGDAEGRGSNWYNLIKAVYASGKSGGKLGSFGIGKFAPFASSALRTVFYSTLDKAGSHKFQGLSILATHRGASGDLTQNTGYYGELTGFKEISDADRIPARYRRARVGTSLYIVGLTGAQDWERKILHALLDNFFKAIFDGNLIIKVGECRVNKNNLSDQLRELSLKDKDFLSPKYFESITSPDKKYYKLDDFDGLGRVELHLLCKPAFPKRVAMVRRSGMVVFHKGHFRTPVRFAGVLQLQDVSIDTFFQALEPPAHDKWEPARYEDAELAQKRVRKLNAWINECVRKASAVAPSERQDVPGIGRYLPDEADDLDLPFDEPNEKERTDEPVEAVVELRPRQKDERVRSTSDSAEASPGEEESGEGSGEEAWTGEGDDNEGDGGVLPGGGSGGSDSQAGGIGGASDGDGGIPRSQRVPLLLKQQRCFCTDPDEGRYQLLFTSPTNARAFLRLRAVGESEADAVAPVSARTLQDSKSLPIDANGEIGPVEINANEKCRIEVVLGDRVRYALEISANAN